MAQLQLSIGTLPNDGTGDTIRSGAQKINSNFTELYSNLSTLSGTVSNIFTTFVNDTELSANLANYALSSDVTTTLGDYVTTTALTTTLGDYALSTALTGLVSDTSLATTLGSYVTSTSLATTLGDYVTSSDLSLTLPNYVTTTTLTTTLGSYVTSTSLSTTLGDYVTGTSLTTSLGDYVTATALSTTLGDYVTGTSLTTSLSDYVLSTTLSDYVTTTALNTAIGNITDNDSQTLTWDEANNAITISGGNTITLTGVVSVTSINDLTDVDTATSAPTEGQVLVWSATGSKWQPGTVSASGTYTLPTASDTVLGGVKVDASTIVIDGNGVISANVAPTDLTGYATETYVTTAISEIPAPVQQTLSFANNQITISSGNSIDVSSLYQDLTGYATETYVTTQGYLTTESDPVFLAHTVSSITNGTGLLKNNGTGTWTYDNSTYLTSYTETDTLSSVTGRGATTATQIELTGGVKVDTIEATASGPIEIIGPVTFNNANTALNNGPIVVEGDIQIDGTVTVAAFASSGTGVPTILSATDIVLDAGNRVRVADTPFQVATLTQQQRDALTPQDGDMIYNSNTATVEVYSFNEWVDALQKDTTALKWTKFYLNTTSEVQPPASPVLSSYLGENWGTWYECTQANAASTVNLSPSSNVYDPTLTGITFSGDKFTNIPPGTYEFELEVDIKGNNSTAEMEQYAMSINTGAFANASIFHPGTLAGNYWKTLRCTGMFQFEDVAGNNWWQFSLHNTSMSASYYIGQAILTIKKIA